MDHSDLGSAILAVSVATTVVAALCAILRIYIRTSIIHSFWWDDAVIIISTVLTIAGCVFNGISVSKGAGQHVYDLSNPSEQIPNVILWNTAYQLDNVVCVNFTKLSILLFVLRIPNGNRMAYIIYFVMAAMTIVNIVTVGGLAAQCRPLAKLWNPQLPGTCFYPEELSKFGYAQGVVNVLTDFFCTITPIVILWNVKIRLRLKIAICCLMSIGLVATASQIVRAIVLNSLSEADYTYQITAIVLAAILDQNLGIIGACIPTFQPLFRSLADTIHSIVSSGSSKKGRSLNESRYWNLGGSKTSDTMDTRSATPKQLHSREEAVKGSSLKAWRGNGERSYPLHAIPTTQRSHC